MNLKELSLIDAECRMRTSPAQGYNLKKQNAALCAASNRAP